MIIPFIVSEGDSPILLCQPHGGLQIPEEMRSDFNENGLSLGDTDWHIEQLYDGLLPDATTIQAIFSRYVIDLNRDPSGASLYPGQNTTELCPTLDFNGKAIYQQNKKPTQQEIEKRLKLYHQPYHSALENQIARIHKKHGIVLLFDCHSIRSNLPFLFEGILPDFNIGSVQGSVCAPEIEEVAYKICCEAQGYKTVLNGRFKGGWTTRFYANPSKNIHCIQLELAQKNYLEEAPPWNYNEDQAKQLRIHLKNLLENLEQTLKTLI